MGSQAHLRTWRRQGLSFFVKIFQFSLNDNMKDNITLAGESVGAVYAHAHLVTGSPVRRGILQSVSLYL